MLNFEADFLVQVMEENLHLEFDVEKVEKFKGSKDIMDFSSREDFFEEYFNLKHKSWGELYDFIREILDIDNFSYDDNILETILKSKHLGNHSLFDCLYRFEYEGGYMIVFITPGTLEACEKEKEINTLSGRLSSDNPFVDKAFYNYFNDIYNGLTFKEFKNAIDEGTIVVFDNRKNFLDWYIEDFSDYKYILDRMREIPINRLVEDIDEYIINNIIEVNVTEFDDCIIMDTEIEK